MMNLEQSKRNLNFVDLKKYNEKIGLKEMNFYFLLVIWK